MLPDRAITSMAAAEPSEVELRAIVGRVVRRTLGEAPLPAPALAPAEAPPGRVVALGADHGGLALKEALKEYVAGLGYTVVDCGTHSPDPVDYPDLAYAVARLVSSGQAWRGILVDGAGIGSAMAANKVPGVRAALCYDHATALNSREHNDANVLTLGAGLIGVNLARQITAAWLSTEFAGGRHQKRVDKIVEIEKRFLKDPCLPTPKPSSTSSS